MLFPDAENNTLQVDSPRDDLDSIPDSCRSEMDDEGSVQGESSIFALAKNHGATGPQDNRDSSGYGRSGSVPQAACRKCL